MNIRILRLLEGARRARGLTVIIDVFRAFTTACYMFDRGAEHIIPVMDLPTAYRLRQEHPQFLLAGERKGKKQEGFDYGNSPFEISKADLSGKTVIFATSAGTRGIMGARGADRIITGSFANAKAIAAWIKEVSPETLSLVCMGFDAEEPADEDDLCAEYIVSLLEGKPFDFEAIIPILETGSGKRFFNPENRDHSPPEDFRLALSRDVFPFVIEAVPDGELRMFRKIDVRV